MSTFYKILGFKTASNNKVSVGDILPFSSKDTVTFFSGSSSGDYALIGKMLKEELSKNKSLNFEADDKPGGGYQNAIMVWQKKNSFAFVQKQAFGKNDYILENIELVTPVYTEHLHILVKNFNGDNPVLSLKTDEKLLKHILNGKTNIGTYGTGSMWIASHLLNSLNKQSDKLKEPLTTQYSLDDALSLKTYIICIDIYAMWTTQYFKSLNKQSYTLKGPLNIQHSLDTANRQKNINTLIFMMAGGSAKVNSILKHDTSFKVVNIDPSFVVEVKDTYGLDIRPTEMYYRGIKADSNRIKEYQTLGTFAYLVTGKNTSLNLTSKIIEGLRGISVAIKDTLGEKELKTELQNRINSNQDNSQKNTFTLLSVFGEKQSINFSEIFSLKKEIYYSERNKAVFIFFISIVLSIIPFYVCFVWIFSGFNYWNALNKLNKYVFRNLPNNIIPQKRSDVRLRKYRFDDREKLDKLISKNKQRDTLYEPYLIIDQQIIINRILNGISTVNKLRYESYELLGFGGLTETHFNFLSERLDKANDSLMKGLYLRLNQVIENKDKYDFWQKIKDKKEYLDKLLAADYLSKGDYDELIKLT